MHNYAYLAFNLLVFLPVLILSLKTDVKPHRHWRAFIGAVLLVSLPFLLWDMWAVSRQHWDFNSNYVLTQRFIGLPFEELLFFVTVPFAMIYVWGVVRKYVTNTAIRLWVPLTALSAAAGSATALLLLYWSNGYTRSAMIATLVAIAIVACSNLIFTKRFWVFQGVLLAIFFIANWILTAVPIVVYSGLVIIGTKALTIPIEDFFFNFAFINLFLVVFNWLDQRTRY